MLSLEECKLIIENSKYSDKGELLSFLMPTIRLSATRFDETALTAVGKSKMGGSPDLPVDLSWPKIGEGGSIERHEDLMDFLLQINLVEVSDMLAAESLPKDGMLYFFVNLERLNGETSDSRNSSKIIYSSSKSSLVRRSDKESRFHPCEVKFEEGWTIDGEAVVPQGEMNEFLAVLSEIEGNAPEHQLMGFPYIVQAGDDMRRYCEEFVREPSSDGDALTEIDFSETNLRHWRLLCQLKSDELGPDWMWGDLGSLYFWIRSKDLATLAFDRHWLVMQSF